MFEEIDENFLKNYQILITANGAQHIVPLVICQIFFWSNHYIFSLFSLIYFLNKIFQLKSQKVPIEGVPGIQSQGCRI